jgi:hypothetical protein
LLNEAESIFLRREKSMRRVTKVFAAVVLVGVVLISTANATILGTVDIQNHNNSLSDTGTLWGGNLIGLYAYTGIYSWTNMGGTDLGALVPNWGFCIELTQGPYNGWQDVVPLEEAPRDFNPDWIIHPTTANKQLAGAFGTAIWEIIYETDPRPWDVTSGTGFHAKGIADAAIANAWLAALNGDPAYFANNLVATSTPNGQDYVVQLPGSVAMPESATLLLFGLGGFMLRKRRAL